MKNFGLQIRKKTGVIDSKTSKYIKVLGKSIILGVLVVILAACKIKDDGSPSLTTRQEVAVKVIQLTGPISDHKSELSGLAWSGDTLILLPQYPDRFESSGDGSLFVIPKSEILAYLESDGNDVIHPSRIDLRVNGLYGKIAGFEGFEAIGFDSNKVYLTIESKPDQSMLGYVIRGEFIESDTAFDLEIESLEAIQPQAALSNFSDESILIRDGKVMTFYEAWGRNVNPNPIAHVFNLDLSPNGDLKLPNIEYRITDVTAPDGEGRFWAINYLFPGDEKKLNLAEDQLITRFGEGITHSESKIVERLVEFQIEGDQIVLTDTEPIQLVLAKDGEARNWEGIVRLEGMGFLLVTDKYPETILGFIPFP